MRKKKRLKEEEEAAARKNSASDEQEEPAPEPVEFPDFLVESSSILQASFLLNSKGQVLSVSKAEDEFLEKIAPVVTAVRSFVRNYPERPVGKTFVEDEECTLAFAGLNEKLTVVMFVSQNTRMGVLNIELAKFLRAIKSSSWEILNE